MSCFILMIFLGVKASYLATCLSTQFDLYLSFPLGFQLPPNKQNYRLTIAYLLTCVITFTYIIFTDSISKRVACLVILEIAKGNISNKWRNQTMKVQQLVRPHLWQMEDAYNTVCTKVRTLLIKLYLYSETRIKLYISRKGTIRMIFIRWGLSHSAVAYTNRLVLRLWLWD